ncbi:helix-turn-helix domain-containing protein [Streptomyces althioticus]|uniref:transcriptional regulator n=1 Tax=Streptomyces althioticus TaxID=83380 RepID=UPI0037889AA0
MSAQDEVTRFAALLRELKGRTDRSYGQLARRLGMNTSTLHRYCAGDAVPVDFAPVERFAALCGASPEERLDLHRLWLRAAEARRRPRGGATPATSQGRDAAASTPHGGDAAAPTPAGVSGPGGPGSPEGPARDGHRPEASAHGPESGTTSGGTDADATPEGRRGPGSPQDTASDGHRPGTTTHGFESDTTPAGTDATPEGRRGPGSPEEPATDRRQPGSAEHGSASGARRHAPPGGERGPATVGPGTAEDSASSAARHGGASRGSDAPRWAKPVHPRPGDPPPHAGQAGPTDDDPPATDAPAQGGRPSQGSASGTEPNGAPDAVEANDSGHTEEPGGDDTHVVSGPVDRTHRPRTRRWRRKRVVVAVAAMCAVLATVGSLSFLPDDRKTSGSGAVGALEESRKSGSGDGAGPARSVAPTGSPSASTPPSPSPSPSARHGGNGTASRAPSPSGSPTAPDAAPAGPPLTWSVDDHAWAHGCGHDYVVAKPPAQVPPPPAPQDARTWAATQEAVHGKETLVELSVQGKTDTAVVLTALRVRVTGRSAPASGNAYAMDQGCGGALTPRYFDVDLDRDRPIARAVAGNDAGTPVPAVRMPYRVSATDPEVLLITARTEGCDCRWWLELDWSSQGRTGTVRIDDRGRPFRTSAVTGLPHYEYDTLNRSWRTRSG